MIFVLMVVVAYAVGFLGMMWLDPTRGLEVVMNPLMIIDGFLLGIIVGALIGHRITLQAWRRSRRTKRTQPNDNA